MINTNLYSIQSSKGGVGKTTLALNLAKSLQRKRSISFIFDLDLCGTSISDMMLDSQGQNSVKERSFGDINVVNLLHNKVGKKNPPENLLSAFLSYINYDLKQNPLEEIGKRVETLKANESFKNVMLLPSGAFSQSNPACQNESQHLLFNEIHAGWFCDFIFKIVERIEKAKVFDNANNSSEQFTINIIFDNAPGWSALRPLIETKIVSGDYKRYKFIFVSSPDEMDIRASVKRICDLYIEYLRNFYALAKFEILKLKWKDKTDYGDGEYKYIEETEFYDEELFSELVGTDQNDLSLPDLKVNITKAQKHPEECFHLIINKSAHLESFQGKMIDLSKLSPTVDETLDNHMEKMLSAWKINNSQIKKDFNKIKKAFRKTILIPFDGELFFHYQSGFISSYLGGLTMDESAVPNFEPFQQEQDDKDYLADFGQLCVEDAKFYQSVKSPKNRPVISSRERTIFLHSARISKAFYLLFEYLLKCRGDSPKIKKQLAGLVEAVTDSIAYYLLNTKEIKAESFNEMKTEMVEKVLDKMEEHPRKTAVDYRNFLIENHKDLLKDNSVQATLAILLVSSIYTHHKDTRDTSIYLRLLPEIFTLLKENKEKNDDYFLADMVEKRLTKEGIKTTTLELQHVVSSLNEVIFSTDNLKNKHNYFLMLKSKLVDGKLSDARVQYIKQLLKIFYHRSDFSADDITSMISAGLKHPLENNISLTELLVRAKLKRLELLP